MINKVVIPVAGFGTRFLPFTKAMPKEMLPIVDKPTIQYIVEEAVEAGITDILFVTASHSNKRALEDHFDYSSELESRLEASGKDDFLEMVKDISHMANIHYIRQKEAKGLGHAINCAKSFIGSDAFAVMLGDDIVSSEVPSIGQLVNAYEQTKSSIMGVQRVEPDQINKYGIVVTEDDDASLSKMTDFVEKPNIGSINSTTAVLGRYILTPTIFDYLGTQEVGAGNEIQLTDAVKRMMSKEDVYAYVFEGKRYDIGDKVGFLKATVDFALERDDLRAEFSKYLKGLDI